MKETSFEVSKLLKIALLFFREISFYGEGGNVNNISKWKISTDSYLDDITDLYSGEK